LRAEEADALVWDKLAEALRNPQVLVKEYDKQLQAGQDAKLPERLSQIDRELNKLASKQNRNLDLYTEGEIDMSTLKKRQEKLRADKASLERERQALQKIIERSKVDMVSVSEFCHLVSQGLDAVTLEEKRQILRLLNIEGRVKDGVITLTGCIPDGHSCDYSSSQQPALR